MKVLILNEQRAVPTKHSIYLLLNTQTRTMSLVQINLHFFIHLVIFTVCFTSTHSCLHVEDGTQQIPNANIAVKHLSDRQESNNEWSEWSEWSPCSRSCDGGISTSLRKCLSKYGCRGNAERHKICSMQPCPVSTDFRQHQCAKFNNQPYRDRFYEWLSYIDPTDPCSLTCKAKGLNFVAKLASRVKDGTRCRIGSLDMCVSGKCLSVGCDLQLGSLKKIDDCGVCGGDGLSCQKYNYSWSHRFHSECSRACGGGFQLSTVVCSNNSTGDIVDDIYCHSIDRLKPELRTCNIADCPAEWIANEWSSCNKPCGTGIKTRQVHCVIVRGDGTEDRVRDNECTSPKPYTETKCNQQECPQWYEGTWSECSETCGNGVQTRSVVCKDSNGLSSDYCESELKPATKRNCSDISKCLNSKVNSQEDAPKFVFANQVSTEPSFIVGAWSTCNSSCGIGVRRRTVECKIYLEFSKTVVTIPESQCPGQKPSELEACYGQQCDSLLIEDNIGSRKTISEYLWRVTGFSDCSAPCLGGTQESIIECIRTTDNSTVGSHHCELDSRPDSYTKTCNDQPCLPRWNITEFSKCSKQCGEGGFQTRIVRCVHEVTRGSTNVVIVPDSQCGGDMPTTKQACNQVDCPPKWVMGPWFKCSKQCGGGIKTRKFRCMKDFAFGGVQEVSPSECPIKKPKILKTCNLKSCRTMYYGNPNNNELTRKSKRNNYIEYMPKQEDKITLDVNGKSVVYEGYLVRLKCPEWDPNTNQQPVVWLKGNDIIVQSKKHRLFKNVLKIRNIKLSDTGVYKCSYLNDTVHSMFLHVKRKHEFVNPLIRKIDSSSNGYFNDIDSFDSKQSNYYKNELDISQEMERYSMGNVLPDSQLSKLSYSSNKLEPLKQFDDSGEITPKDKLNNSYKKQPNYNRTQSNKYPRKNRNFRSKENNISESEKKIYSMIVESSYKDLQYNWITTDWSKCTIPCGGIGFKMRLSQCYVKLDNVTQTVDSSFCIESGLDKPKTIEKCGFEDCSLWKIGKWSECDNCIDINKGLQSRSVNCILSNGTVVEEFNCLRLKDKPNVSQECINEDCVPFWLTGQWSKCHASCNESGYRTRPVQCVWKVTEKPADYTKCSASRKPDTVVKCFNQCNLSSHED